MMFLFLTMGITVFAGNINEDEQRVIDVVSTPVTYNGKQYVTTRQNILRVTAYLNQDNVNLSKEQADTAIRKFYDNIETGVRDGYMEEVKSDTPKENDNPGNTQGFDNEEESSEDDISYEQEMIQTTEELPKAQDIEKTVREKEILSAILEEHSLPPEETEELQSEGESESESEEIASNETSVDEDNGKDFSDAEPFRQTVSLTTIAIAVVLIVTTAMVCMIFVHKSRHYKKR